MTTLPSFNEVLKLILFGRLSLEIRVGRNWFTLRDEDLEMAGLLLVRPDWKTGRSDRPGLMPVIQHIESQVTGFRVEGHAPAIDNLSDVYDGLRERLAPSKLFCREDRQWKLTAFKSPPKKY